MLSVPLGGRYPEEELLGVEYYNSSLVKRKCLRCYVSRHFPLNLESQSLLRKEEITNLLTF